VRRSEQVEELKQLGADYVINSETEDIVTKVKEITQGAGVKYTIDAVGGKTGTQMINTLSKKGIHLIYGRLAKEPIELDCDLMTFKRLRVHGFWLTEFVSELAPEERGEILQAAYGEIIQLLVTKQITLASKTFPAKDFQAALDHVAKPGKNEKTVLLFNY